MFGCLWLANSFRVFVGVFGLLLTAFCTARVSFASLVSVSAGVFRLDAIACLVPRLCSFASLVKISVGMFGFFKVAARTGHEVSFRNLFKVSAFVFGLCAISHRMCSCGCTVKVFRM